MEFEDDVGVDVECVVKKAVVCEKKASIQMTMDSFLVRKLFVCL